MAEQAEVAQAKRQQLVPVSMEAVPDLFAAQHTYTSACDGFHEPGQCPRSDPPSHLWYKIFLPPGMVIDGAVVELSQDEGGFITADVRIPASQP